MRMADHRRGLSISRRRFVQGASVAGLELLAGCGRLPWPVQSSAQTHRLGILWPAAEQRNPITEGFRGGLHQLGYVEDRNLFLEWRFVAGREHQAGTLAVELVRLPVDIIVAFGTPTALAAKHATATTPIVVPICVDPVGNGLVDSLARPGGNVTGLAANMDELSAKRLQLLKELLPGLRRVGVLWNPLHADPATQWRGLQGAAPVLDVQLEALELRSADQLASALAVVGDDHFDALFVLGDPVTFVSRARIAELAVTRRVPVMYDQRAFADAGGLISYGPDTVDQVRRAAVY